MFAGKNFTEKSDKVEPVCAEGTDFQNSQTQLRTDKSSEVGKASTYSASLWTILN